MILYPTETVYGLGVDVFDRAALARLALLKGRDESQAASWLVRDLTDLERYAELSECARAIAEQFLPGPLTLVLPARPSVVSGCIAADRTIGFRISSDPVAGRLAATCGGPITCTSANVHGMPTLPTPQEVLAQFGDRTHLIDRVIDDGPRTGAASTVVRVRGSDVSVLREGAVPAPAILELTHEVAGTRSV